MFIAILDFDVAPADADRALDQLLSETAAIRAMAGCHAYRAFADPLIDTRVTVLHEWETADDFAAYLASPAFARSGKVLRPMMTAPPSSRRFAAELVETAA